MTRARRTDDRSEVRKVGREGTLAARRQRVVRLDPVFDDHPAVQVAGGTELAKMGVQVSVGHSQPRLQFGETAGAPIEQAAETRAHGLMEDRVEERRGLHPPAPPPPEGGGPPPPPPHPPVLFLHGHPPPPAPSPSAGPA